jgi:signal transduction histidine kinase
MSAADEGLLERREDTNASLGAERASSDATTSRAISAAERARDDLIERDRHLADERLSRVRLASDRKLASAREASEARISVVTVERAQADAGTRDERTLTDALMQSERDRSDHDIQLGRRDRLSDRSRLTSHRHDTDVRLLNERTEMDAQTAALDVTKEALQRADETNDRRSDVFGMVAHDLRSPLFVMSMTAESIVETTAEASTREAAEDMVRAAARMERLLTDLLDVARIEAGTLRVAREEHDVGALVGEVVHSYGPLFTDRGMTFGGDVPEAYILGVFDRDRIVQVLSNLLGNAMKFMTRGGVATLRVEQRGPEVLFELRDSGPGIRPDALPHVFERFWQLENTARRGLGLGLHICEKIVDAHGGRIWAESDLGHGAVFRFTVPASSGVSATG